MAAIVVPFLARSSPRTRSCLVIPLLERDAVCALFFVFDLSCFARLVLGLRLVSDLAIRTSEVGDTIVAPPRPRSGEPPAGYVPKRCYGVSGINTNARFAAEVQPDFQATEGRGPADDRP